jgi:hypothetical protein
MFEYWWLSGAEKLQATQFVEITNTVVLEWFVAI